MSLPEETQRTEIEIAQRRGVVVHLLVAAIAAAYGAMATRTQIDKEMKWLLVSTRHSPIMRQSRLAFIETAVAAYFHWYAPYGWRFVGAEQIHHGVAFDLVWTKHGRVLVDELKSGLYPFSQGDSALRAQLDAQAEAGFVTWGDAFVGVRPVRLGDVNGSHEIKEKDLVRA